MLPLEFEVLVAPRDIDMARIEVSAVLPHLSDVQGEAAAHGLGDGLLDLLLSLASLGPKALNHLAPMLDLDESAPSFVTGAPHGRKFLARFEEPILCGKQVGDFN